MGNIQSGVRCQLMTGVFSARSSAAQPVIGQQGEPQYLQPYGIPHAFSPKLPCENPAMSTPLPSNVIANAQCNSTVSTDQHSTDYSSPIDAALPPGRSRSTCLKKAGKIRARRRLREQQLAAKALPLVEVVQHSLAFPPVQVTRVSCSLLRTFDAHEAFLDQ